MEILIPAVILTQRRKDAEYAEIFGRVALVATVGNLMEVFKHGGQENMEKYGRDKREALKTSAHSAPLGTRFARLCRFPMGRDDPQGAVTRLCVKNKTTSH